MIRSYGIRIAIFAAVGLLFGLCASLLMPPKYEGVMQILVDQSPMQQARMMSKAEESVQDILQAPRARTVATQVEQLTGFGVLAKASQAVHSELGKPLGSIEELQLLNLQKALTVDAAQESDVINLRLRLGDKQLVQDTLANIFLAYDQQNQESSRAVGARALTFLESQTKTVETELNRIDDQMQKLREQYGVPNVDQQVQAEILTVRNLDEAYQQARMDYAAAAAQAGTLRAQLRRVNPVIESGSTVGINANYQRLEAALADAKAEKAVLLTQWQEGSQPMKGVNEKIRNLTAALKGAKPEIPASKQTSVNPLYQNLSSEVAQADSRAAAAAQKLQTAQLALSQKQSVMKVIPNVQRQMDQLTRQQSSLTQTYLQYKDALESLRVSQRGRLTASTLVSPPFVNPNPVSPNIPLNLAAGLIAGCLLGVLSAFASESKKSPIRNLTHLNRLAFEPSFRAIPELPMATPSLSKQPDDAYIALLGNFIRSGKRPYRIGVMGVDANAGATTTAAALAVAAVQENFPALVIESGDGKGVAAKLGLPEDRDASPTPNLTIVNPAGDEVDLESFENGKSLIISDLQPFRTGSNPVQRLSELDECVLLVRAGQTRSVDFLQAQQMLADAGVQQVTVVLSRARNLDDDFGFAEAAPPALAAR